jgi:hypothetical protein
LWPNLVDAAAMPLIALGSKLKIFLQIELEEILSI